MRELFVGAVRDVQSILENRPVDALVESLDDGAIKFRVRCWIDSYADFRHARDRVQSKLYTAFQVAGLQTPTPTYHFLTKNAAGGGISGHSTLTGRGSAQCWAESERRTPIRGGGLSSEFPQIPDRANERVILSRRRRIRVSCSAQELRILRCAQSL